MIRALRCKLLRDGEGLPCRFCGGQPLSGGEAGVPEFQKTEREIVPPAFVAGIGARELSGEFETVSSGARGS